mmetsp:Transcript_16674/g.25182  ORF Transcript_16674/g.25182 Transcript_16674/m.25182 type:complete len:149 (-) Transcript_16674:258-704(-)
MKACHSSLEQQKIERWSFVATDSRIVLDVVLIVQHLIVHWIDTFQSIVFSADERSKDRKIEQLFPVTIGNSLQQRTVDSCSRFYSPINSHICHSGGIDIGSLHGVIAGIMKNRKGNHESFSTPMDFRNLTQPRTRNASPKEWLCADLD